MMFPFAQLVMGRSFADDITKDATNTLKNEASTAIRDSLRGIFRR